MWYHFFLPYSFGLPMEWRWSLSILGSKGQVHWTMKWQTNFLVQSIILFIKVTIIQIPMGWWSLLILGSKIKCTGHWNTKMVSGLFSPRVYGLPKIWMNVISIDFVWDIQMPKWFPGSTCVKGYLFHLVTISYIHVWITHGIKVTSIDFGVQKLNVLKIENQNVPGPLWHIFTIHCITHVDYPLNHDESYCFGGSEGQLYWTLL
jgi:hypothetical protein